MTNSCNMAVVTCEIVGSVDPARGAQEAHAADQHVCSVSSCDARMDKEVSCDNGLNFNDKGFVKANEDGTFGCDSWNAQTPPEGPTVRYLVRSNGTAALANCTITESNKGSRTPSPSRVRSRVARARRASISPGV